MMKKVVMFNQIAKEILGVRGNKYNNKRRIDVNILTEAIDDGNLEYGYYRPGDIEIAEMARDLFLEGVKDPCIMLVREREKDSWQIVWDRMDCNPVIFNVNPIVWDVFADDVVAATSNQDYLVFTWSHDCYNYNTKLESAGYFAEYGPQPLATSVRNLKINRPAITVTLPEMAKRLQVEQLTLADLDKIGKEENTYGELVDIDIYQPNTSEPCFLMIGDKLLCVRHRGRLLPYFYNATGIVIDSYTLRHLNDDMITIFDDQYVDDHGIGVEYKKDHLEDWR